MTLVRALSRLGRRSAPPARRRSDAMLQKVMLAAATRGSGIIGKQSTIHDSQRLRRMSGEGSGDEEDDLPYHVVHPMPSFSRSYNSFTDHGRVIKWNFEEGQPFAAGDALGEIDTDQGVFELEAQEEGFVARHLIEAEDGGGVKIEVGIPILVTVEEEEDVATFRDFVPPAGQSRE
mmetsp:Transcript_14116/g.30685  ORF Transcript_14116/g.30685 Transcript_14116/m.30685 type:complete len:176 (+) Transcript_14116:193-720(+)